MKRTGLNSLNSLTSLRPEAQSDAAIRSPEEADNGSSSIEPPLYSKRIACQPDGEQKECS